VGSWYIIDEVMMDLLNLRIALLLQREKERERETSLN